MNPKQPPHDPLLTLGLALLELIDCPIAIELEQPNNPAALALHGILLRAFDDFGSPTNPTMTLMIGAHSTTIRLAQIRQTQYHRDPTDHHKLLAIRLLLSDEYTLHIKPAARAPNPKNPQP